MPLDLRTIAPKDTITLDLEHPASGKPLGATITLSGPAHPETLKAGRAALDKQLRKGDKAFRGLDSESIEREVVEALASRTLGWEGLELDGSALEFSRAKAVELYMDPDLRWLRDQVDAALRDNSRFFGQ
jgi:hypothetical protein